MRRRAGALAPLAGLLLAGLLPAAPAPAASPPPATEPVPAPQPAPLVVQTMFRHAPGPDTAPPERSFSVERTDKRLYTYEIRLRLAEAPRAALPGQTVTCRARLSNDRLFEFAYRDQTFPAGRAESDSYALTLPDSHLTTLRCLVGPWPGA